MIFGKGLCRPFASTLRRRSLSLEALEDRLAPAVTIQIDYSHDTSGFFADNPAAKTALNSAAEILGASLNNNLPAIAPGGGNTWSATFFNPSNPYGADLSVSNPTIPANTLRVFAGGANLSLSRDGDLSTGAPGGYTASGTNSWLNLVAGRGQPGALAHPPTGDGLWGGAVSFDESTDWSYSGTPGAGQVAFLPVALHELTHVLGIGTADSWFTYVNAATNTFTGPHAEATPIQIGNVTQVGPVPLDAGGSAGGLTADNDWASDLLSAGNPPLMDIDVGDGQTLTLTPLDWAGLADVGWSIDHLAVTTEPGPDVTVGTHFGLAISAEDPDGAVDTLFHGKVTIKLGSDPDGGKLGGTLTATAVDGIATFSALTINQIADGYTIQVSSAGLPGNASNSFDVIAPGKATNLVITTPPTGVTAGGSFGLVVEAEDGRGDVDSTFTGSVTLALVSAPTGGVIKGTLTAVASNGVATFSGLLIDQSGAGYQIVASTNSLAPATSNFFSVAAGMATHLVVTTQPPANVLVNNGFAFTVAAEDAFGNIDPTFNGNVTVALGSNPGSSSLSGSVSVAANDGVANFTGLMVDSPGSGYTLKATAGRVSVTSNAFAAATTIAPGLTIDFNYSEDSTNFFALHPQAKTVLQEAGQILGSMLHDNLAAITPSAGDSWVAAFLDPSLPSSSYIQLANLDIPANTIIVYVGGADMVPGTSTEVSSDGWTASGSSAWINLVGGRGQAGARTTPTTDFGPWGGAISFNQNTDWSFAGTAGSPGPGQVDFLTVALQQLGSILGIGTSASWAHGLSGSGTTFVGAHAEAAYGSSVPTTGIAWAAGLESAGQEPLFDMALNPGERRQLTPLDVAGLADVGWTVDQLAVTAQPAAIIAAGSTFSVGVSVLGPDGTVDAGYTGPVTLALGNKPGNAVLRGTLIVHAIDGVATFSGLTISAAGDDYTLLATIPNGSSVVTTTNPFTVAAGLATHLVITTKPPAGVVAGSTFAVDVSAEDAKGNVDTSFNGSVIIALAANPGAATLGGTLTVTASNGVATFSDLALNKTGAGYTLRAGSTGLSPAMSKPIKVSAGTATQLVIAGQPAGSVVAGRDFSVIIKAEDSQGNVDPTFTGTVALSLAANPGGSKLGGKLTVKAVKGVATFTSLTLDVADAGYALQASATDMNTVTTNTLSVTAGAATHLVATTLPPASIAAGEGFTVAIAAEDAFGNINPNFHGNVSLSLFAGTKKLAGTLVHAASAGIVTFTNITVDSAASDYSLKASSPGLPSVSTPAFSVTAAVAQPG